LYNGSFWNHLFNEFKMTHCAWCGEGGIAHNYILLKTWFRLSFSDFLGIFGAGQLMRYDLRRGHVSYLCKYALEYTTAYCFVFSSKKSTKNVRLKIIHLQKMGGCRGYFLALFWVIENNSFFGSLYYIDRMEMVSIFIVLSIDVYIPYRHGALELL